METNVAPLEESTNEALFKSVFSWLSTVPSPLPVVLSAPGSVPFSSCAGMYLCICLYWYGHGLKQWQTANSAPRPRRKSLKSPCTVDFFWCPPPACRPLRTTSAHAIRPPPASQSLDTCKFPSGAGCFSTPKAPSSVPSFSSSVSHITLLHIFKTSGLQLFAFITSRTLPPSLLCFGITCSTTLLL